MGNNKYNGGDWNAWSKYVLKELERLSDTCERIEDKMNCKVHEQQIKTLQSNHNRLVAAIITIVIALVVSFIKSVMAG